MDPTSTQAHRIGHHAGRGRRCMGNWTGFRTRFGLTYTLQTLPARPQVPAEELSRDRGGAVSDPRGRQNDGRARLGAQRMLDRRRADRAWCTRPIRRFLKFPRHHANRRGGRCSASRPDRQTSAPGQWPPKVDVMKDNPRDPGCIACSDSQQPSRVLSFFWVSGPRPDTEA